MEYEIRDMLVEDIKHAMDCDVVDCEGINTCGLCDDDDCACGLPKWENECINLLRRSLTDEQLAQFFETRSNEQAARMAVGV